MVSVHGTKSSPHAASRDRYRARKQRRRGIHLNQAHKGRLHRDLGVPAGQPIPAGKLAAAKHSADPAVRKRATFAENAKHWHHGG